MLPIQIIRRNAESKKQMLRLVEGCTSKTLSSEFVLSRRPLHLIAIQEARFSSHSSKSGESVVSSTSADHRRPMSTTHEIPPLVVTNNEENETNRKKDVSKTSAYLQLGKAKLSGLVVTTTLAGFIAAGGPLYEQVPLAGCCVVGTALCSFSAAALNQIYERDRDSMMKRTQKRPLVTGALTVNEAKLAATAWGVGGTTLLLAGTDPVTTLLGLGNIGLYAGLYTYMKPRSVYNTWVGAVVGAIPPVMGWTAATSGALLDLDAIILGSTLYYWQLPHFFALSYMYRVDYERGGFCMLSSHEVDGERTSSVIMRNAIYLSAIPFLSTFAGVTSSMFALEGIALNSYALWVANRFRQERTNANARKVFLTSLWYLPSWLVLFLLHSKVWDEDHDRDVLRDKISDFVHAVRNEGRKMCIHERVLDKRAESSADSGETHCPVTLSKKAPAIIESAATSALEYEAEEKVL
jgi:protoheme IX farnesyltransferase